MTPNILFITTDQQRWDYLGLHQTPGLRTPYLDRIGREGRFFPNTYTVSPICTPCRVSLLTGKFPSRHGAVSIGSATRFESPTLPELLQRAGYATGLFGKSHFVPRPVECHHAAGRWQQGDPLPVDDLAHDTDFWAAHDSPYLGFERFRGCAAHNCDRIPDQHYRAWLRDQGADLAEMDALHRPPPEKRTGRWDLPPHLHQTAWITEESIRFIREAEGGGRPWFCWTSIQDPHSPFVCPDPWFSDVPAETQPPAIPDHPGKPAYYQLLVDRGIFEDGAVRFYDEDKLGVPHTLGGRSVAPEKALVSRRAYKAMCNMIDHYLGRIFQTLEDEGTLDNTWIVFTSDHGDFLGDHGIWYKGLPAFDESQRVPLVVRAPSTGQRGECRDLFSLIDLPSTFLSIAGLPIPPDWQGLDQSATLSGSGPGKRECVLVECNPTSRANQFTLVTPEWKLVVYQSIAEGELYHRPSDPAQRNNLWLHPGHAAAKTDLLHTLSREILRRDGHQNPRIANA